LFFNPAYAGDGIPHMRDEEIFLPVCDILIMAISYQINLILNPMNAELMPTNVIALYVTFPQN